MTSAGITTPACYEILVQGLLDPLWCDWFNGLNMERLPDGNTRITGALPDQPALRAVIERIFDLNLPVLLIRRIEP